MHDPILHLFLLKEVSLSLSDFRRLSKYVIYPYCMTLQERNNFVHRCNNVGSKGEHTGAKGICSAAPMRYDRTEILSTRLLRSLSKSLSAGCICVAARALPPAPFPKGIAPMASLMLRARTTASCKQHTLYPFKPSQRHKTSQLLLN